VSEFAYLHDALLPWYADHARDLPWRAQGTTEWAVLVSEVMLQQTPVARVRPVFDEWMRRWPEPTALAADPVAEAIRAWGRLGYPRRAVRLHAAAGVIADEHAGRVPNDIPGLRALPGVGEYTAAAVAAFAFGAAVPVLDTNVRRVLSRVVRGEAQPAPHLTNGERTLAADLLPDDETAPRWSVAVMELGALVCTAASPGCSTCPLAFACTWLAEGSPPSSTPQRSQPFAGTDRQVRGLLMGVLREARTAVPRAHLDVVWADDAQRERALASLLDDGLAVEIDGSYRLPH
jgi:A/G-specific adenine glycosylase